MIKVYALFFRFGSTDRLYLCEDYSDENNQLHFYDLIGKQHETICKQYFRFEEEVEINAGASL